MSLISEIYKILRVANDVRALRSPKTMIRRAKNKIVGRTLGKLKIWR